MERTYKFNLIENAGLCVMYSLVFFLCAFAGCKPHTGKMALVWKNHKAVGVSVPRYLLKDLSGLRFDRTFRLQISGAKDTLGMIGDFDAKDDALTFTPPIPLTPGMSYTFYQDGKPIATITVPVDVNEKQPELLTIYPETDTVPENLLKFYIHFSKPMQTGRALEHVYLLDKNKDTMRNVFLNLQPELWDTSSTTLTLWIDPGRIKRGLVLNQKLGNPLKKAETYQLMVSQEWKDEQGMKLSKTYTKNFVTGERDGNMPDINKWKLTLPKAGTSEPLIIDTGEPMDHYLLQESVGIIDWGKMVYSVNTACNQDKVLKIVPIAPWKKQAYKIRVLARLEDLAGNNLNRVFDRDITKDKQTNKEYFEREFEVK